MGRHRSNNDCSGFSQRSFWELNKQKKLKKLADEAIKSQQFKSLANNVVEGLQNLRIDLNAITVAYNTHTHVISGTFTVHHIMKLFAEAKFKSFRIEVFTNVSGGLGDIKISDTKNSKTDRIGRRKLRKAKKVLVPTATMWFGSGFKETMGLGDFIQLTLKK